MRPFQTFTFQELFNDIKFFNPMGFDSYNHFLKIRESIGTLTPKERAHLEV